MRLSQGIIPHTPQWEAVRLKRLTSSYMHKIYVSGQSKDMPIGVGGLSYIDKKIGEMITGKSESEVPETDDIMRGLANEPDAVLRYAEKTNQEVAPGLLFEYNSIMAGTTDGEVCYPGSDEIKSVLEIKCPRTWKHVKVCKVNAPIELKKIDPQYYHQIQSNIMICEAEYGDFASYNEDCLIYDAQIRIVRVWPDMAWRKEFKEKIDWIADYMMQSLEDILKVDERNLQLREKVEQVEIEKLQSAIATMQSAIKN